MADDSDDPPTSSSGSPGVGSPYPPTEEWRPVVGFEGRYEVSSLGRVRSIYRFKRVLRGMWIEGYRRVCLFPSPGVRRLCYVQGIVAEAFHGRRPEGHQVNHLNRIRSDNRPDNLEWVTPRQNIDYSLPMYPRGEKNGLAKLTEEKVRLLRALKPLRRTRGKGTSARSVGEKFGISESAVFRVWHRQGWKHVAEAI